MNKHEFIEFVSRPLVSFKKTILLSFIVVYNYETL
jgi:hypothetical protein